MKFILVTLTTILASTALAEKISLVRTSKQGVSIIDVLEKKEGAYFFSGQDLGKNPSKIILSDWKYVFAMAPKLKGTDNLNICYAGTYHLAIDGFNKKAPTLIQGCLDDPAYAQVLTKVRTLRRYALAQKK